MAQQPRGSLHHSTQRHDHTAHARSRSYETMILAENLNTVYSSLHIYVNLLFLSTRLLARQFTETKPTLSPTLFVCTMSVRVARGVGAASELLLLPPSHLPRVAITPPAEANAFPFSFSFSCSDIFRKQERKSVLWGVKTYVEQGAMMCNNPCPSNTVNTRKSYKCVRVYQSAHTLLPYNSTVRYTFDQEWRNGKCKYGETEWHTHTYRNNDTTTK